MLRNLSLCKWYPALALILLIACNRSNPESKRPSFKAVEGIKFIEVRREFDTGLSFSEQGFQQIPEWTLYFLPGDSVKIYSPFEKRYIHYPIYFDHGQVINFAREFLRVKHISRDSIILQLLRVQAKVVNQDLSKVYMRFYSENYIKNVLHADPDSLRKPNSRDTLFIKTLIDRAKRYPNVGDSLFAARQPVSLKSKVDWISVVKKKLAKNDIDYRASDEYLYPEYTINIQNAYKDFSYTFTAYVDDHGKITVGRFASIEEEFVAPQRKVMQGIVDVYLQRFLEITPGQTLGIQHPTEITLHLRGTKD